MCLVPGALALQRRGERRAWLCPEFILSLVYKYQRPQCTHGGPSCRDAGAPCPRNSSTHTRATLSRRRRRPRCTHRGGPRPETLVAPVHTRGALARRRRRPRCTHGGPRCTRLEQDTGSLCRVLQACLWTWDVAASSDRVLISAFGGPIFGPSRAVYFPSLFSFPGGEMRSDSPGDWHAGRPRSLGEPLFSSLIWR